MSSSIRWSDSTWRRILGRCVSRSTCSRLCILSLCCSDTIDDSSGVTMLRMSWTVGANQDGAEPLGHVTGLIGQFAAVAPLETGVLPLDMCKTPALLLGFLVCLAATLDGLLDCS